MAHIQCDQIWRNFATLEIFQSLWQKIEVIFSTWQNVILLWQFTYANWANLHHFKWPNIEQTISPSGHTSLYLPSCTHSPRHV